MVAVNPAIDTGFYISEDEYEMFKKNRPALHNDVAREDPNQSIFDAFAEDKAAFNNITVCGKGVNDLFKSMLWGK